MTLTEKFDRVARETPRRVSIVVREGDSISTHTCGVIHSAALKVASWLCLQGVRKGDRVALALENSPDWCICYFGILYSGAIAVPLDIRAGAEEKRDLLDRTRSRALFTSEKPPDGLDSLEKIIMAGAHVPPGGAVDSLSDILESEQGGVRLPTVEPDDLASIIFTSGTTGRPKGVMLTHSNFCSNLQSLSKLNYVRPGDVFLSILPLHHAFPFMVTLIVPLFLGVKIIYLSPLKTGAILDCLREQEVTHFAVTPQVLQLFHRGIGERLAKLPRGVRGLVSLILGLCRRISRFTGVNLAAPLLRALKSTTGKQFRYFVCGGAKLDANVASDFFNWGFTVLEGYGLTETSPVVSLNSLDRPRIGSAGRAIPGVEISISGPVEDGVGEVLIRGDNVMKGYYRDEAATRDVIVDGWFRSGDRGRIDRDGYLFIEGRIKDVIVLSSGKNVSAEEVEAHYAVTPCVRDICVFADTKGEKLVAVVVPDFGYFRRAGESNIRERVKWELELLSERISPYKRLKNFVLVDELAKTRLGKLKRHEAIKKYEEQSGKRAGERGIAPAETVSETGQKVLPVLAKETGVKNISVDDHLELDLGIDSLGRISLMTALEKACDTELEEQGFLLLMTVAELIAYVEDRIKLGKRKSDGQRSWDDILSEKLPPELAEKIDVRVGVFSRFLTIMLSIVAGILCKIFFRLKASGREHLLEESFIICPNHASYIDPFILFCVLPFSLRFSIFFLGFSAYFEVPVIRNMLRSLRVIPVDYSHNVMEAMQASAFVLRHGKALCVFPEGARSISGEVGEFKKGVSIIARESGAKIVPAYISGSYRAWKSGARFPRPSRITVRFGEALLFEELRERGERIGKAADPFESASAGLRDAVLGLRGNEDRLAG